jgi:hypothetical protein
MHRTRLLGIVLAVAAATAVAPGAAAAADAAPRHFTIDVGTSESARPAPPSGIIAVLIGLQQAPPRTFSGDAYDNEMG